MNTPDIALAALIIACISMVGSLISDTILLYEYNAYLQLKDDVKTFTSTMLDLGMARRQQAKPQSTTEDATNAKA